MRLWEGLRYDCHRISAKNGKGSERDRMRLEAHDGSRRFRRHEAVRADIGPHVEEDAGRVVQQQPDQVHVVVVVRAETVDKGRYAAGRINVKLRIGDAEHRREAIDDFAQLPEQVAGDSPRSADVRRATYASE